MKLTALMLFLAFMQVSASTFAQKVTLSERNASLTTIFEHIRNQTGYDFAYTTATVQAAKSVTIDVKNMELDEVLKIVFDNQPLDHKIDNKSVVVSRKEPSLFEIIKDKAASLLALPGDVHGRVIDTLGRPVMGANVSLSIKGYTYVAMTDNNGEFYFTNLPQDRYTLLVTYVGYNKLEKLHIPKFGYTDILPKYASATAGEIFADFSSNSMEDAYARAMGEARNQYTVGYLTRLTPSSAYRQVEVRVARPDVKVFAKDGYYPLPSAR